MKKYLYCIIAILLFFSYFSILSFHSAYIGFKDWQQKEIDYQKRIVVTQNVLNDLNRFYPGLGSGSSEIIESILDDQYKIDKLKMLDPLIEEKTRIMLKLHGIKNYDFRYKKILDWPIKLEDRNSAFIISEFLDQSRNDNHTGLDIQLFNGSNIVSAGDGIVKWIGESKIYGKYIIIRHYTSTGYLDTYYGHIFESLVSSNQIVSKGQHIAYIGKTGKDCTGEHLHFEVRYYKKIGIKKNGDIYYGIQHLNPVLNSTWNNKVREDFLTK